MLQILYFEKEKGTFKSQNPFVLLILSVLKILTGMWKSLFFGLFYVTWVELGRACFPLWLAGSTLINQLQINAHDEVKEPTSRVQSSEFIVTFWLINDTSCCSTCSHNEISILSHFFSPSVESETPTTRWSRCFQCFNTFLSKARRIFLIFYVFSILKVMNHQAWCLLFS